MDFDDIEYTEWQIHKIRVALNKYRTVKASRGGLPNWTVVRDDICCCEPNIENYNEDDAELAFKSEALRRFAEFKSVLKLEKLQDVTRFLLHENLLTIDSLDESQSGLMEFLSFHEYLANSSENSKKTVNSFDGFYVAGKSSDINRATTLTLRLVPDPSGTFLRVDEQVNIKAVDAEIAGQRVRPNDSLIRINRVGYAFPVTSENRLHIFLNGFVPDSRVTYVQACNLRHKPSDSGVLMMRADGEFTPKPVTDEQYRDGQAALQNVYHFTWKKGDISDV